MKAVVADASPLNYLILIGKVDVLPQIFERIILPVAVRNELLSLSAPLPVQQWAANLPIWIEVAGAQAILPGLHLHPGESEAISLALEMKIDSILLDDRDARSKAKELGLRAVGLLAILADAHELKLLEFDAAIGDLRRTNFRISAALIEAIRANLGY